MIKEMNTKRGHNRIKSIGRKLVCAGALTLCVGTLSASAPYATESLQDSEALGYIARARNMMEDKNYVGVIDQLNQAKRLGDRLLSRQLMQECNFMLAKAYYERGDEHCVDLLENYVLETPTALNAVEARLMIGDYYFYAGNYGRAIESYNEVDLKSINSADSKTYSYRKGLSLTKVGMFDEARPLFKSLLEDKEYGNAAQFYIAYLDYVAEDYDKALKGFKAVDTSLHKLSSPQNMKRRWEYTPTGLEAGYYITHIEYHKGEYRNVINHGTDLLQKSPVPELIPEMNRIIGESYYKLGEESVAWQYLDAYLNVDKESPISSALYTMGVIEYNQGNYKRASELFGRLTDLDNELGQSAYLYLGQCAMRNKDNSAAAIAFEKAYKMGWDLKVSETALYNYTVASISGGSVPFSSSIELFENFTKKYPQSKYSSAVDEYLATAYYHERDFTKALQSINRINNPSDKVMGAKQKVLYELGVEAYSNGRYNDVETYMMQVASLNNYDSRLSAQSWLWLGDAYYAKADYEKAEKAYQMHLDKTEKSDVNRSVAFYNLGYAQYMSGDFNQAILSYKKSLNGLTHDQRADATLRIADCYYYTGKPKAALKEYAEAISKDCKTSDYAALQHANMQGMIGYNAKKIDELNDFSANYPTSKWIPAAMLEKAQTLVETGKTSDAIREFKGLASKYPQTAEARQGMLQMAIVYSNMGKQADAEEAYKEVITRWPSSEQAASANDDLRRIYASRGELQNYRQFLSSIPDSPQLNDDDMEQLTFEAAENDVAENADDIAKMKLYVEQYPNGKYLASALYYVASSYAANSNYKEALEALNTLISRRGDSNYAPDALKLKGEVMEKGLLGEPMEIVKTYKELELRGGADYMAEAYSGVMRNTTNAKECVEYADKLLQLNGLSTEEQEEARFYRALASFETKNIWQAEADLKELTSDVKSIYGAKAAVELATFYMSENRLDEAEKVLTEFTDEGTPHQYWLARGFIALADLYEKQGKKTIAKEYVKSLKENYPGEEPDIHDMINQRINNWK